MASASADLERPPAADTMTHVSATVVLAGLLLVFVESGDVTAASSAASPPGAKAPGTSVTDVLIDASASGELQRAALARLEQSEPWRALSRRIAALEEEFDAVGERSTARTELILDLERRLRAMHETAASIVADIGAVVRRTEQDRNVLEANARNWQERASYLENALVPAAVVDRARAMGTNLQRTDVRVREFRDRQLLLLDRAVALQARIDDAHALVAARQEIVRTNRMQLEQSPLWRLNPAYGFSGDVGAQLAGSWRLLREYVAREAVGLSAVFFGVLILVGWLFTRRSDAEADAIQRAYGRPFAASLLIALMVLLWLAPDPPILFYGALLALVPIPAAMVVQRAFATPVPLSIYGLAASAILLTLRTAIAADVIADRVLLLLQSLSVAVPLAVDLHRGRLQQAFRRVSPGTVRAVALLVIAAASFTILNVIFGFRGPERTVRAGMGSIVGFGLVFGATAVAIYGAALALLSAPITRWSRSARSADPTLLLALRAALTVLAIAGVMLVTVGNLGLITPVRDAIDSFMESKLDVGTVSIAAKAVASALVVALTTLVLTGLIAFLLDREILPRFRLRPGAGYAIVTFTRWAMLLVGTALTLAALGLDMAKVTLIAGALGVGIGFGLQNVVNNFVAGLILIVERPVGVGDLIEIGPLLGEVKRIGIRSSTVRTTHGAEVILPNGELTSKEVVNWTRSDRQRRYDIDVGVAYGSQPEQVMRLLVEAAKEVPEIMIDPAPFAMFRGFGDSSLDFRLLAWVHSIDVGLRAQSALRVAILRKLDAAGIQIPFPQRDLHIRSDVDPRADDRSAPALGALREVG